MFKNYSYQQILLLATNIPIFLFAIFAIFKYKKSIYEHKYVMIFFVNSLLFDVVQKVMWIYKMNNLYVLNIYSITEFFILWKLYQHNLNKFIGNKIFYIVLGIFYLFCILNMAFYQGLFSDYNSNTVTLESLIFIVFAQIYFYKILTELNVENLFTEPMFWINIGVLIYFSSDIFIFIFSNYLMKYSQSLNSQMWGIHAIFLMIFCTLLSISLCVSPKAKKPNLEDY